MKRSMFARRPKSAVPPAWLLFLLAAVLVGLDRLTKFLVETRMTLGQDIPVLGPLLHLLYLRNDGAAFSQLRGMQWLLIPFTCAMVAVCAWALAAGRVRTRLGRFSLALIIAGGVGNLIDRIATGEVVDFLYIKLINFAVFNVADCCVVVGAVLLCLSFLLEEKKAR